MSTIREFFEGEMRPADARYHNPEYLRSSALQENLFAELKTGLSDNETELLDKIMHYACIMEYEYGREMFATGFSLGVRLTAEGFCREM